MAAETTPPGSNKPSPPPTETRPTVVQRTITLRVDLRALAALGGALIIIGALLPWVTPLFQPFMRVIGPATSGGWPLLIIGALAMVLLFWPRFNTPRVSLPVAVLGLVAGILALSSTLNTIELGRALIGDQTTSPLAGIGIGVYLTLAGSIIAILAGLAPATHNHEPARAEIHLWQASTAILASLVVLCGLGAVLVGAWLGNGGSTGRTGAPTTQPVDAGILATPLINVEVNPLTTITPNPELASTTEPPTAAPTPLIQIAPTQTPNLQRERPTDTPAPVPTRVPPSPTHTPQTTATPTATGSPTATPPQSPLQTPTMTLTPTMTDTPVP